MKYTRLRLIRKIDRNELSLENIKKMGIKIWPTKTYEIIFRKRSIYFEKYFSIGMDEEGIISFPCGGNLWIGSRNKYSCSSYRS